ncbi:hypothetical protein [Pseudaminobacter sp. NGMCC 1.201702]|uniref:hypothetical protein n=1 Tax=Pseudaminobacter sp. NGMCC 1.201702 TaxID=3391825 RepID=UPI0039F120AD
MFWFIVGAALGLAQLIINLVRKPISGEYATQAFGTAVVLGAAVYGTTLWLVSHIL